MSSSLYHMWGRKKPAMTNSENPTASTPHRNTTISPSALLTRTNDSTSSLATNCLILAVDAAVARGESAPDVGKRRGNAAMIDLP
jgi:hypothetical protein